MQSFIHVLQTVNKYKMYLNLRITTSEDVSNNMNSRFNNFMLCMAIKGTLSCQYHHLVDYYYSYHHYYATIKDVHSFHES